MPYVAPPIPGSSTATGPSVKPLPLPSHRPQIDQEDQLQGTSADNTVIVSEQSSHDDNVSSDDNHSSCSSNTARLASSPLSTSNLNLLTLSNKPKRIPTPHPKRHNPISPGLTDSPSSLPTSPSRSLSQNFKDQLNLASTPKTSSSSQIDTPKISEGEVAIMDSSMDSTPVPIEMDESRRSSAVSHASSVPTLAHSSASASTSSLASMEDTASTPPTTATPTDISIDGVSPGAEFDERELGLKRYREGLYSYTRDLYLQAKLSNTRLENKKKLAADVNLAASFGLKQSGMERLAAKKALAKRLNAC